MSTVPKALLLAALVAIAAFGIFLMLSIRVTGSGGLGAVSAGVTESLMDGILAGILVGGAYWLWRHRSAGRRP